MSGHFKQGPSIKYIIYTDVFGAAVTITLSLLSVLTGFVLSTRVPGGGSMLYLGAWLRNVPGFDGLLKQ